MYLLHLLASMAMGAFGVLEQLWQRVLGVPNFVSVERQARSIPSVGMDYSRGKMDQLQHPSHGRGSSSCDGPVLRCSPQRCFCWTRCGG